MHLQLLSDETGLILEDWQQDDLLTHLKEYGIDLPSLLPQGALMPLAEWNGLDYLSSTLSQYLASFKSTTTQQEVSKPLAEMTEADKAEFRASIAPGGGGHRSESRGDVSYEVWKRLVVVEPTQKVEDTPRIGALLTFLAKGIQHRALLKSDSYGPVQTLPGASTPSILDTTPTEPVTEPMETVEVQPQPAQAEGMPVVASHE